MLRDHEGIWLDSTDQESPVLKIKSGPLQYSASLFCRSLPLCQSVCSGAFDCMFARGLPLSLEQADPPSSWQAGRQACKQGPTYCPPQITPQAPHLIERSHQDMNKLRVRSGDCQVAWWHSKSSFSKPSFSQVFDVQVERQVWLCLHPLLSHLGNFWMNESILEIYSRTKHIPVPSWVAISRKATQLYPSPYVWLSCDSQFFKLNSPKPFNGRMMDMPGQLCRATQANEKECFDHNVKRAKNGLKQPNIQKRAWDICWLRGDSSWGHLVAGLFCIAIFKAFLQWSLKVLPRTLSTPPHKQVHFWTLMWMDMNLNWMIDWWTREPTLSLSLWLAHDGWQVLQLISSLAFLRPLRSHPVPRISSRIEPCTCSIKRHEVPFHACNSDYWMAENALNISRCGHIFQSIYGFN